MTILASLLLSITLVIIALRIVDHLNWRKNFESHYSKRFVEVITKIYIHPPYDEDDRDDEITDDPILRKALGVDKKKVPDSKEITVRTTIDLEEVYNYTEWTSSSYSSEKYLADCIMIYFKTGDYLLIYEKYDIFQTYYQSYLTEKEKL